MKEIKADSSLWSEKDKTDIYIKEIQSETTTQFG